MIFDQYLASWRKPLLPTVEDEMYAMYQRGAISNDRVIHGILLRQRTGTWYKYLQRHTNRKSCM